MTIEQKYLQTFQEFVELHNEMMKTIHTNPFQLTAPEHKGLEKVTVISDKELDHFKQSIKRAADDQNTFMKIFSLGNSIIEKVKFLIPM
ncbi:MAG: hypothetical protein ACO29O_08165 [Chitinophagaceae bacterium]